MGEEKRRSAPSRALARPALLLLLVLAFPGCAIDKLMKHFPVTSGAAIVGGVVTGGPVLLACLPVTIPIGLASGEELVWVAPGVPPAIVGAVAFGLPVILVESIVWIPRLLFGAEDEEDRPVKAKPRRKKPKPAEVAPLLLPDPDEDLGQPGPKPEQLDPLAPPREP